MTPKLLWHFTKASAIMTATYAFSRCIRSQLDELVGKLIEPGVGQYALGAFDADRLIGVANYAVSDDPTVADIAILVAHEDHLRGVGTALLRHLAEIAEIHGIRRFVADILAENQIMFQVMSDLAGRASDCPTGRSVIWRSSCLSVVTEASAAAVEVPKQGVRDVQRPQQNTECWFVSTDRRHLTLR